MQPLYHPARNHLLASLPKSEIDRLSQNLEPIEISCGETIYRAVTSEEYIYFPTTALVSLFCISDGRELPKMVVVGNDGVIGVTQLLGGKIRVSRAVVHTTGYAYRMKTHLMQMEYNRSGPLLSLLLGYVRVFATHVAKGPQLIESPAHDASAIHSPF